LNHQSHFLSQHLDHGPRQSRELQACRRRLFRFLYYAEPPGECPDVSPFFVADLDALGFVVMDSSAVTGMDDPSSAADEDNDDDSDDDDEAGSGRADDLIGKIWHEYLAIAESIPAPT
jgi:hypothetical protein